VGHVRHLPVAVVPEDLDGQDPHVGGGSGHADPVAGDRGDHAGDTGAVAVTAITGAAADPLDRVVAGQHLSGEVDVVGLHAGVEHRDDHAVARGRSLCLAQAQARVLPLLGEQGVAGGGDRGVDLEIDQVGVAVYLCSHGPRRALVGDVDRVVVAIAVTDDDPPGLGQVGDLGGREGGGRAVRGRCGQGRRARQTPSATTSRLASRPARRADHRRERCG
jgi:hypothetical protein